MEERSFKIFDSTFYLEKPEFKEFGIEYMPIVYAGEMWARNEDRTQLPKEEVIATFAKKLEATAEHNVAVVDIEHWPWVEHQGDVAEGMRKYLTVLGWYRKYAPSLLFGYYGVPPVPDYDTGYADRDSKRFLTWQTQNDLIAPLANASHVLFPSLYAFSTNTAQWVASAISHIQEARRYGTGAPIYVFLWPQYHDFASPQIALQFLDREFWQIQIDTAFKYADGMIIWGGWDIPKNIAMKWDDQAPWWNATQSFISHLTTRKRFFKYWKETTLIHSDEAHIQYKRTLHSGSARIDN